LGEEGEVLLQMAGKNKAKVGRVRNAVGTKADMHVSIIFVLILPNFTCENSIER